MAGNERICGQVREGVEDSTKKGAMTPLSPEQIDSVFDIMPLIGELLHSVLEFSNESDATNSNDARQQVARAAQQLNSALSEAEKLIDSMPGGEMSNRQQKERYRELSQVLGRKRNFVETILQSGASA